MRYVYSVLRFVPDARRGESVNIGAIVGSEETSEWELRLLENPVRARALDESHVLEKVWVRANELGQRIDAFNLAIEEERLPPEPIDEQWLTRLSERAIHVLQFTPPAPLVAETLDGAAELVAGQLLVDPERRRYPFKKKNVALGAVSRAFREYQIRKNRDYFQTVEVQGSHHKERFDFAIANGHALQLTQTWSFQVPEKEGLSSSIRAWAWAMRDIRKGGGVLTTVDRSTPLTVDRNVEVAVVYVPPASEEDERALEEAMSAFDDVEAKAVSMDDAIRVGQSAADLLARAG